PALSLLARPGDGSVRTRCVAMLVADGVDGDSLRIVKDKLDEGGAVSRFVGQKLGQVTDIAGQKIIVDVSIDAMPPVLFDGLIVPAGDLALLALGSDARARDFVKEQYRHGKTILALGAAGSLLAEVGIPDASPTGETDPGIVHFETREAKRAAAAFIAALAKHRHPQRETDPPLV
ncbi:MAG: DJ-1/PfpI family protein, partial [Burkholderiaceae bacterium]